MSARKISDLPEFISSGLPSVSYGYGRLHCSQYTRSVTIAVGNRMLLRMQDFDITQI